MDNATPCLACGKPVVRRVNRGPRPKFCFDPECKAERVRQRATAWYVAHRDDPEWKPRLKARRSEATKRWAKANPDHVKAKIAEWRAANPEAIAEQYRRWRIANADRVLEKNQRRRARLLDAFVEQVDPDVIWERDGGICQLCGDPIDRTLAWPEPFSRTLDHIVPLAKGGTHEPANVQLAHAACNSIKGDRI